MSISAVDYYKHLKSYLNMNYYAILPNGSNSIKLKERIFTPTGDEVIEVNFTFKGEVFAIKLDKEIRRGSQHPLFHFLDDQGKPWSRRCDFVVFQLYRNINVYCIEYKYQTLSIDSIISQLDSSAAWCQSLHSTIKHYTKKERKSRLTKYVFSKHPNPNEYLDSDNKYLRKDPSIRHYHYNDVDDTNLEELENNSVERIG